MQPAGKLPLPVRIAMADRIEAAWYDLPPGDPEARLLASRCPGGRRRYRSYGEIHHGCPGEERRPAPPEHAVGRERLRAILTGWRSDWMDVALWDASRGGDVRRALCAAGIALLDASEDGRERADALVLKAAIAIRLGAGPGVCDRYAESLAKLPVGEFKWELAGKKLAPGASDA